MATVNDLLKALEELYPPSFAFPDDAIGLQVGSLRTPVRRVLVALDPDSAAVETAVRFKADLIVAHHPIWWKPPRRLIAEQAAGRGALDAVAARIAVISAHTNADFAPGGLCDAMADRLGLCDVEPLCAHEGRPAGRVGLTPRVLSWNAFLASLKKIWGAGLRYGGLPPRGIRRIAVCSGSGSDLLEAAFHADCDALVTGDVKYHAARDAESYARIRRERDGPGRLAGAASGFVIVDAGHFETEIGFAALTARRLKGLVKRVEFRVHRPFPAFRIR